MRHFHPTSAPENPSYALPSSGEIVARPRATGEGGPLHNSLTFFRLVADYCIEYNINYS
jgi:hypothetical protein